MIQTYIYNKHKDYTIFLLFYVQALRELSIHVIMKNKN